MYEAAKDWNYVRFGVVPTQGIQEATLDKDGTARDGAAEKVRAAAVCLLCTRIL